ncbi:MAG: UDP-N-acetylmuramate--L-alanine ligase [bacterium]
MDWIKDVKKAHIIGIGGIGVSAVARLLLASGVEVSGSDFAESGVVDVLRRVGAKVTIGHAAENLPADVDLVVRTSAVPDDNPELAEARRRKLRNLSYFEFLGEYARGKRTVAVAGTNGKSTTTAMLGLIMIEAGFDPTVIVGTKVPSFDGGNLRLGGSNLLIVEACEYQDHFLNFSPAAAIVTNVEEDHLDYFTDRQHIMDSFGQFLDQVRQDGLVVLNANDSDGAGALSWSGRTVRFGSGDGVDYLIGQVKLGDGLQTFHLMKGEQDLGEIELHVPGRFNVENAATAAVTALEFGAPFESVRKALSEYAGIWRRFEIVGEPYGGPVVSDYGHHPTAVEGTIAAAREFYPDRKIVLVFQPHHRNRTRNLFDRFVRSFDGADSVVLLEIYDVIGREEAEDAGISSRDLLEAVIEHDHSRGVERQLKYAASLDEGFAAIHAVLAPGAVTLVLGAGDVDQLARRLAGGGPDSDSQKTDKPS